MRIAACAAAAATLAIGSAVLVAQPAPTSSGRIERGILTGGEGPRRLAVDLPLLSGAAPFRGVQRLGAGETERYRAHDGLADLRLFDREGREVPYLLLYPPAGDEPWVNAAVLPIAVVETRSQKTSGFEADFGTVRQIDMVRIEGLPAPFLKRCTLEGSGDRQHWTLLDGEATLFDLPQEKLRQLDVPFRGGAYRYLRVTWDDTHSGRVPLPHAVSARRADRVAPPPPVAAQVSFERRTIEPGRSRYRIRLPRGNLPIVALTLDVGGGHVYRTAFVTESRIRGGEAAPAEIGRAVIARVTRDNATASRLRVPIVPPREPEITLVIEDGSNPPLDLRAVQAEFAELPWIYFEAPAGPVRALYGDPRAQAPRYDLEAARASIGIGDVAEAKWEEPRTSAAPPPPAPQNVADAGAPLDAGSFRHQRALPDGPPGLAALTIDAAMLAGSRGPGARFGDVRILDAAGRQVPYVLERREDALVTAVTLEPFEPQARELRSEPGRTRSVYRLRLPYAGLPQTQVVLETTARVFDRTVQVGVERKPDRHRRDTRFEPIGRALWQHADESQPAPPISLSVGTPPERELLIVVDEGDNAPLPIANPRILLPAYRLRFYRGAGPLRVVYGRDDLTEPRYDLALLSSQVMGAEPVEVSATPPDSAAPASPSQLFPARYFWIGLGLALAVLLGIIAKLLRSSS